MMYVVTVRINRGVFHSSRDEVIGDCPLSGVACTDITGEYHSEVIDASSTQEAWNVMLHLHPGIHIIRVEGLS